MHGSLVGTWQSTKFMPRYRPRSRFVATGEEEFTGCLDSNKNGTCDKKEPSGSLKFTLMYWASFDPASGALLHGDCVHPVTGGSGELQEGRGLILMEDTPTGAGVITTYAGTIEYQAAKGGQRRQASEPQLRAARAPPAKPRLRLLIAQGGGNSPAALDRRPAPWGRPRVRARIPTGYAWRRRARLPDSRFARGATTATASSPSAARAVAPCSPCS